MSNDFTGVASLIIPEGSVKKITRKLDGAIKWEKPDTSHTWAKYSITNIYEAYVDSAVQNITSPDMSTLTCSTSYSFDTTTGAFELLDTVDIRPPDYSESTPTEYPYYFHKPEDKIYFVESLESTGTYNVSLNVQELKVKTVPVKGDFIEYATSTDETEYPEDGVHTDGYWYVKQ